VHLVGFIIRRQLESIMCKRKKYWYKFVCKYLVDHHTNYKIWHLGQCMWDLWWTKREWDMFFFFLSLSMSASVIIPPMLYVYSCHLQQVPQDHQGPLYQGIISLCPTIWIKKKERKKKKQLGRVSATNFPVLNWKLQPQTKITLFSKVESSPSFFLSFVHSKSNPEDR
jgi:hypothetical protein